MIKIQVEVITVLPLTPTVREVRVARDPPAVSGTPVHVRQLDVHDVPAAVQRGTAVHLGSETSGQGMTQHKGGGGVAEILRHAAAGNR